MSEGTKGFLAGLSFGVVVCGVTFLAVRDGMRAEAVDAGCARWVVIDKWGTTGFEWIRPGGAK